MASISSTAKGQRIVQFVGADGKRRSIRLGKMSLRMAEAVKLRVEQLASAAHTGHAVDRDTARWVAGLDDRMVERLAAVGLVARRERPRLEGFMAAYIDGRQDVKPASKTVWRQGERSLVEHFGADRHVHRISTAEAEAYKQALLGKKLAAYTVRKRLQFAKLIFTALKRRGLVESNPFDGVQVAAVMDESRNVFVSRDDVAAVLGKCPDSEWKAIVALSRYGGLRCPSETLSLRWEHIDWEKGRITVISPKTAHHPGGGQRTIPMFPELVGPLRDAFESAPEGASHVITRHRSTADSESGWRGCNLRTRFEKIICRAGLTPWPRLFHALRASCETELVERFPVQVVTAWLGNSPKVALKHYLRVLPEHFDRALGGALQNPVQHAAETARKGRQAQPTARVIAGENDTLPRGASGSADGEGFEPPVDSRLQRFSRPPP
jgi:integrase